MPPNADDRKCVDASRGALAAYLPPLPPLPPTPPLLPPPPPLLPMMVSGGGCAVYPPAGQCVRSTGYGGTGYSNNEACTINNLPAVPISVTSFSVDANRSSDYRCVRDYLTVNGARYCGSNSPEGIVPNGTSIEWRTDSSKTRPGWELCFPQAPPPPPPPSQPLLDLYQPIGDATGNARRLTRLLGPLAPRLPVVPAMFLASTFTHANTQEYARATRRTARTRFTI